MRRIVPLLLALLSGLWVMPAEASCRRAPLILISVDGLRPDYLDRGITPALAGLRAAGASGPLLPPFPSKTFPSHFSMVTGLAPDRHGIVGNSMTDPARPGVRFQLGDAKQALDPFWWQAEPIWVTAEKAGVRTATMFWPGSEVAIGGVRPTDWQRYDQNISNAQRVRTVIDWLRRPDDARPCLVTLYFDSVDAAGHRFGPDSAEQDAATRDVDARIGDLLAGLATLGVEPNILVVSDHGMAATAEARTIRLDRLVRPDWVDAVEVGPYAAIIPAPGRARRVEKALLRPHDRMDCRRKGDWVESLDHGRHPRVPAILCLAAPGWQIVIGTPPWPLTGGAHGWPVQDMVEMRGLLIASGPAIAARGTLPPHANVEVYPLIARLLGVVPVAGDASGALATRVAEKD